MKTKRVYGRMAKRLALLLALLLFLSGPVTSYAQDPGGEQSKTEEDPTGEQQKEPEEQQKEPEEQQKEPENTTPPPPAGKEEENYTPPPAPPVDPDKVRPKELNAGEMDVSRGHITNNSGTILENFGTIENNTGTVVRHFYNMNTAMAPDNYNVNYGEGFRMEKNADGSYRMFLEAGRDGIITITPAEGRIVSLVKILVNGVEITLEPLGDGRYKIPAIPMPEGPDGFAMNEGGIIVITEDGEEELSEQEAERRALRQKNFEDIFKGNPPTFADLAERAGKKGAIRIEGIPEGRTREEVLAELSARPDIQLALIDAVLNGEDALLTFITEDGIRVTTTRKGLLELMKPMMPLQETINYKDEEKTEEEKLKELVEIIEGSPNDVYVLDYKVNENGFEIVIEFNNEEDKKKFEKDQIKIEWDNESSGFMSETAYFLIVELGLDLKFYSDNPQTFANGTFIEDVTDALDRKRRRENAQYVKPALQAGGLPEDLLDDVSLDWQYNVLLSIENGWFRTSDWYQRYLPEGKYEAILQVLDQTAQEKAAPKLTAMGLPADLLYDIGYEHMDLVLKVIDSGHPEQHRASLVQEMDEDTAKLLIDRLGYALRERIQNLLEQYGMPADMITLWDNATVDELMESVKQFEIVAPVEHQRALNKYNALKEEERKKEEALWAQSQQILQAGGLPSELLDDIPLEQHLDVLRMIEAGSLEKNRAELEKAYGKDVVAQLIRQVKQAEQEKKRIADEQKHAQVRDKLKAMNFPQDLLDDVPADLLDSVLKALASGGLEKNRAVLAKYIGADGVQKLEQQMQQAEQEKKMAQTRQSLQKINMPANLLDNYPPEHHAMLLEIISANKLGFYQSQLVAAGYKKETVEQMIQQVQLRRLENLNIPADLYNSWKNTPGATAEMIDNAITGLENMPPKQRQEYLKSMGRQ